MPARAKKNRDIPLSLFVSPSSETWLDTNDFGSLADSGHNYYGLTLKSVGHICYSFFFLLKSISCELSARRLKLLNKDDRISCLLGIPHEFF